MLKKEITYLDYNDVEQTETFYFNLTKIELTELDINEGGLENILTQMVETNQSKELYALFRKIILSSVGRKSPDGRRFVKDEEITKDFISSPAFDALFMELFQDAPKVMRFITEILPKELHGEIEEAFRKAEIAKTNSPSVG